MKARQWDWARFVASRVRRWDVVVIAAGTFVVWLIATPPSAYFIQNDTPAQDFVALAWSRGCWEYVTEKMLPVLLLRPLFKMFGPSPHWETLLLGIAASVSTAATYELTRLTSGSGRLAGMLGGLMLMALPAFQLFSRTYMGYVIPCMLLGWLAIYHHRWGWAGLSFGLAVIAHFNSLVPVGISSFVLAALFLRPANWKNWLVFALAGAAPILALEILFFAYMGRPFQWSVGTASIIFRFSGVTASRASPNWLWLPATTIASNGPVWSALLALGLLAPYRFWRNWPGLALRLASIGFALFYAWLGGVGRSLMVPHLLVSVYPFWAICAGAVVGTLVGASGRFRRAGMALATAILAVAVGRALLFIHEFSQTPYPQVEQAIAKAAAENRPVRYQGNTWAGLYYAQRYGVAMLVNDRRWIEQNVPGQAVLMFLDEAPESLSRAGYTITASEVAARLDSAYPALTFMAAIPRRFELWWPTQVSLPVRPDVPPDPSFGEFYYPGSGCLTPPAFMYGTMHFYQLAWYKLQQWVAPR